MILIQLSFALAASFTAELSVPSQHYLVPDHYPIGAERVLAYDGQLADQVVASDHPLVTCYVKDGYIIAKMEADADDYPTSFPFQAKCSQGGNDLLITVIPFSPATDPALQSYAIDENGAVHITRPSKAMVFRSYHLPKCDAPYDYGVEVDAGSLDGVTCKAFLADGHEMVEVYVAAGSDTGTGVCSLPLQGGGHAELTVNLAEAPI